MSLQSWQPTSVRYDVNVHTCTCTFTLFCRVAAAVCVRSPHLLCQRCHMLPLSLSHDLLISLEYDVFISRRRGASTRRCLSVVVPGIAVPEDRDAGGSRCLRVVVPEGRGALSVVWPPCRVSRGLSFAGCRHTHTHSTLTNIRWRRKRYGKNIQQSP